MLSTEQFFEHWLVKNYNDFLRGELHETNCYFSLLLIFRSEKKGPIASFIWNFTIEIPFHHILRLPGNNITEPIDPRRLKVPSSIFYFLILLISPFCSWAPILPYEAMTPWAKTSTALIFLNGLHFTTNLQMRWKSFSSLNFFKVSHFLVKMFSISFLRQVRSGESRNGFSYVFISSWNVFQC